MFTYSDFVKYADGAKTDFCPFTDHRETFSVKVNGVDVPVYSCTISRFPFNKRYTGFQRSEDQTETAYFVNPPIEPYLIDLCKTNGYVYVKLDDISLSEENWGEKEKFPHNGVRKHPGDRGMKLIAGRIFAAIEGAIKGAV